MAWLLEYAPVLSLGASLLMLVVWIVYLNLFWLSYRRQLRANVVISRGAGAGLDSLCIVGNMSAEPIFIEGVIVFAEAEGQRRARAITDFSEIRRKSGATLTPEREGPLKAGDYITVGTFRDLLRLTDICPEQDGTWPSLDSLEVWIVADFSSEHDLVFARRKFLVGRRHDRIVFRPAGLETRRITRARERREVEAILQQHLEEATDRAGMDHEVHQPVDLDRRRAANG